MDPLPRASAAGTRRADDVPRSRKRPCGAWERPFLEAVATAARARTDAGPFPVVSRPEASGPPLLPAESPPRRRPASEPGSEPLPFAPPPSILGPPLGSLGSGPSASGSSGDRASVAALAERLLGSMAVGPDGRGGHEVRLQLRAGDGDGSLEVRLRSEQGRLSVVLCGEEGSRGRAEALASRLERELARRGVGLTSLEVRTGRRREDNL